MGTLGKEGGRVGLPETDTYQAECRSDVRPSLQKCQDFRPHPKFMRQAAGNRRALVTRSKFGSASLGRSGA